MFQTFCICYGTLFVGLVTKSFAVRVCAFIACLITTCYLLLFVNSGAGATDYFWASCATILLFMHSDLLLLTDAQNELRQRGQKEPISRASLMERMKWVLYLMHNTRGVGWTHEPGNGVIPPRPTSTSRVNFILSQVLGVALDFVMLDILKLFRAEESRFYVKNFRGWAQRVVYVVIVVLVGLPANRMLHRLSSIIAVGTRISTPQDWPPLFGSWSDAYTVRRTWGRVWHQYLRRPFAAHGRWLASKLGAKRGSSLSSYIQLYTAFLLSGILHQAGDSAPSNSWYGRSIEFFILQALFITFEDAVVKVLSPLPLRITRIIGYSWTFAWFALSLPMWQEPMLAFNPDKNARSLLVPEHLYIQ